MKENPDLADAVERLTDELRVVRDVLDELREQVQWASRNPEPRVRITSLSLDPCAKDFKVNAIPPEKIEELRRDVSQKALF